MLEVDEDVHHFTRKNRRLVVRRWNFKYGFTSTIEKNLTVLRSRRRENTNKQKRVNMHELRRKELAALQDEMLKDLSTGIDRLGRVARTIGDETTLQTKLLDGIEVDVEKASEALQEETRHAERVKEKAQIGRLWCMLLVQIVVVIFLVIVIFIR